VRVATTLLLFGFLLQANPRVTPEPKHFRFERAIELKPGAQGRSCAALDGAVYAHSTALTDVRLYAGGQEVPYALSTSQTEPASDAARVLNLGERGGHIVFDLAMPSRPYSVVDLQLSGSDFLATAKVTGLASLDKRDAGTSLGTFTLFDLSGQRLGRSTSLELSESSFPFLHVDIAANAAPGHPGFKASPEMVDGAEVPPSREAQTIYTTVAENTAIVQGDRVSIATFELPARVPVERVSFELQPGDKTNFSRSVEIRAKAMPAKKPDNVPPPLDEVVSGDISRVRITEDGKEIRRESLDVPATLGSNSQDAAKVTVAVENGDDKPLAIRAVRLEMRQRMLCFDAPAQPVTMYYGDDKISAPVYDYSRLFVTTDASQPAQLGAAQANPIYEARVEQRSLTDRHPEIVWLALLAVVAALGFVAFRSAKRV
jgi:hypothetical protein